MKLRNKKTGEIKEYNEIRLDNSKYGEECYVWFDSLAELNEEWEDYEEEPKDSFWTIGKDGTPIEYNFDFDGKFYEECDNKWVDKIKEIGLYFETKEEAEKAVECLRAWKRLKDIGCRFDGWNVKTAGSEGDRLLINLYVKDCTECEGLLDFLFGGENE